MADGNGWEADQVPGPPQVCCRTGRRSPRPNACTRCRTCQCGMHASLTFGRPFVDSPWTSGTPGDVHRGVTEYAGRRAVGKRRTPTRCASAGGLWIGVGWSGFTSSVTGLGRLWSIGHVAAQARHGVLRRWSPQAWLGADQERRSAPARQVQVSRERDSGWACRCGTTTFMTLTSLLPAGRVRPRYGAMTAASSSATW